MSQDDQSALSLHRRRRRRAITDHPADCRDTGQPGTARPSRLAPPIGTYPLAASLAGEGTTTEGEVTAMLRVGEGSTAADGEDNTAELVASITLSAVSSEAV